MTTSHLKLKTLLLSAYTLVSMSTLTLAQCSPSTSGWNPYNLQNVAYALGLLMVVVLGVKYIVSDSAQERSDVKKGLIYVVIGLLVVSGFLRLINMYCCLAGLGPAAGLSC